ncbi:MAG: M14 family metallopeptidase [Candidatus Xenobia bacterium]
MKVAAASPNLRPYSIQDGDQQLPVAEARLPIADRIDTNHDGILQPDEIKAYLQKTGILKDPKKAAVDEKRIVGQYVKYLQGVRSNDASAYHSYDQAVADMKAVAAAHPDFCQMVSLGKSVEGRDIWAMKMTTGAQGDTSNKPGVVIDGCHHAREWNSVETPLALMHQLADGAASDPDVQKVLAGLEVWIVSIVNPDGLEYSRNTDNWWRKNRDPVADTGCSGKQCKVPHDDQVHGVDINRNYDDGIPDHAYLYRPPSDKPCDTSDDFGETSDDPDSDVYRGPKGASEPETQAMTGLWLGHKNIKGVIDHHSYGNDILHPWSHTTDHPDRYDDYMDLCNKMASAMDQPYAVESGCDLYPTSGDSNDCEHVNGLYGLTVEQGSSFQPDPADLPAEVSNVVKGDRAFLDWMLAKFGPTAPPPHA